MNNGFNIINIMLLGVGVLFVYSGFKKKTPLDILRSTIGK